MSGPTDHIRDPKQEPVTSRDLETFTRWIEEALNDPRTPVGYCGWPDCPICHDRGLLPEREDR